tara:strand:+ start:1359 stop:2402 length:1044 start_codon:yes stop_codon:yes gene_type:complete
MNKLILAGDFGGTKSILATYESNKQPIKIHEIKYISSEWKDCHSLIKDYLKRLPSSIKKPSLAVFAVAGPVFDNNTKMTNLNWKFEKEKLRHELGIENIDILNDFTAQIYGISRFRPDQYIILQEGKTCYPDNDWVAVAGAGTGLGVARGIITENEIFAYPSEGGHREFTPRNEKEWELYKWVKEELNITRVSIERIVSGGGIENIIKWILSNSSLKNHQLNNLIKEGQQGSNKDLRLPELAYKLASEGDSIMKEVFDIWLSAYAAALGDIAIHEICCKGLWISGGIATKHIEGIKSREFRDSLRDKGRFTGFIDKIPIRIISDPKANLYSAACRGQILVESSEKLV